MPSQLTLGPLTLNLYGFFIALGLIIATKIAQKQAVKYKAPTTSDEIWSVVGWGFIGGLIGARTYHVIDYWDKYSQDLPSIFAVWNGGLGIYGGILGGAITILLFAAFQERHQTSKRLKHTKKRWLIWADLAALGLPFAQAIGRWGNYVNQELYGLPTNLAWGIFIDPINRLNGFELSTHFHPLFLYESIWMFLIGIIMLWLAKYLKIGSGWLLLFYLLGYAEARFWLEFLRINPWQTSILGFTLTTAQWIGIGIWLAGISVVCYGWKNFTSQFKTVKQS